MSGTGAPDEFPSKSVGQRALIASGGVIMNIITAAVFFILAFTLGVKFVAPEVWRADPGTLAERIGLREGDRIRSYNGDLPAARRRPERRAGAGRTGFLRRRFLFNFT